MCPRALIDSYTGEKISDYYTSPLKDINNPITLYKDRDERASTASYKATRLEDGQFAIERCAQAALGIPSYPLGLVSDELWAERMLDWFVHNDRALLQSIEDFLDDPEKFFAITENAMRETRRD